MKRQNHGYLQVLYEDNHLIAINKPAGYLVQGDITGDKPLSEMVKMYIKDRYNKQGDVFLGTIHRLDRPVSGVLLFARTSKAVRRMNELFRNREIHKTYLAVVAKRPNPLNGHISNYLLKDGKRNFVKVYEQLGRRTAKAKLGELDYKLIGEIGNNFLLEVNPLTGRPHQIRAQLAHMGYPIVGDRKYGSKHKIEDGSILLHCQQMSFIHPVKKEKVVITVEPPEGQIWELFGR